MKKKNKLYTKHFNNNEEYFNFTNKNKEGIKIIQVIFTTTNKIKLIYKIL